jgi:L-alanine-DL-glutamate epimerase-like enolase superfamily enzyme
MATVPNPLLEYPITPSPLRDHAATPSPVVVGGRVRVPDAPGLGVALDADVVSRYRSG